LAEEDRHRDALGDRTIEFISQTTRELIDDLGDRIARENSAQQDNDRVLSDPRLVAKEVVCVPARDEADELVGMMFAQILQQAGSGATYLAIGTVNDMLDQVEKGGFRIACVSALPPFAVGQARSLCKRLRARVPDLAIIVGLWEFAGGVPKAQERVGASCTDAVVTSLSEGLLQVRRLSELTAADTSEKSKAVGKDDEGREAGTWRSEAAS
jgi:hypothetical protein